MAKIALATLDNETDLDIYANIVAQIGRVSKNSVITDTKKYKLSHNTNSAPAEEQETKPSVGRTKAEQASISRMRFVISRMLYNAKYVNREIINVDWFTEPTAKVVVEWIKSKGTEDIIIGDMFAAIPQTDEMNAYLDEKRDFSSEILEENYYKDCLIQLANDYIRATIQNKKASLNDATTEEKRQIMQDIGVLNQKLLAQDLESKII